MTIKNPSDQASFWNEYLAGAQSICLPAIARHSKSTTGTKAHNVCESLTVSAVISETVLLASWTSVLASHTIADDITFGVIFSDNPNGLTETSATLPLRVTLAEGDSLDQIVRNVEKSLKQIKYNTRRGFAQIREFGKNVQIPGDFGSVLYLKRATQYDDGKTTNGERHDCNSNTEAKPSTFAPISVTCEHLERSTRVTLELQSELPIQDFVRELLLQYVEAISQMQRRKDVLDCTAPLRASEPDFLVSWTRACEPVPKQLLLHSGIEEQGRLHPLAVAIGETESVMMYQELNTGADLLARKLLDSSRHDSKGSQNVGVCFEKSACAIMSMLAILKAGRTYVPLDVDWPEQRIAYVMEDAQITTVLCSKNKQPLFKDQSVKTTVVDDDLMDEIRTVTTSQPSSSLEDQHQIEPTDAAYILYTSGSTGKPKGISISHRAIMTSITAMARFFNMDTNTRTFQHTTFTFDLSVADIWMTLNYGGRICLPSEEERLNPGDFLIQEHCNYTMTTPSLALTVEPNIWKDNLQILSLIGESVPEKLLQDLATPESSNFGVRNTWGPTEACVIASSSGNVRSLGEQSISEPADCIGFPVGASIFIVDPKDPHRLAPPFAPGEIALVGNTLATCYYGNEAKTAEAFRTDLEWAKDKKWRHVVGGGEEALNTVYLTGDIGRYSERSDGSVIFMHRKEGGYVKVNGYRIDPGEVENSISRVSEGGATGSVSQRGICVVVRERSAESTPDTNEPRQVLVAFFVEGDGRGAPAKGCKISEYRDETKEAVKQVVQALREAVPEYMVPQLFVPLVSLPTSSSHKIDRKYLQGMVRDMSWQDLFEEFGS